MRFSEKTGFRVPIQQFKDFLVTAIALCLLGGCGQDPSEKVPEATKIVEARVETIESASLPVYAVLPGVVVSADRVEVASRLTGYVYNLEVHEGQTVRKGQLLFAVDPTGVKAEIRQAQAELDKARATLADAAVNYRRYKGLYEENAATTQQYQQREKVWKVALGGYRAAEAVLATARAQLKYAEVRAPFEGLVVARRVDNGQLVSPAVPLLVMEDPNHLQVQAQIPEQAFVHLSIGQEVHIDFEEPGYKMQTVTGYVERLVAAADPVTHTHLVKIGIPARSGPYSGEYALVNIPVGEQQGIIVPAEAVYNRAGITGVFVVNAHDQAQFRMVTTGGHVPRGTVILSGLFPGDRLIVSPRGPLSNGVKIRIRPEGRS